MYLGNSSSNHLLWDVDRHTVLRVPVAAAKVEVGKFRSGCKAPADEH
jgi:hypothetical protein